MYVQDLSRLSAPYPPMFYGALGYDVTSWDAVFFWRNGHCFWTDASETGFANPGGWWTFVTHPVIAPTLTGWRFGSQVEDGTYFLMARPPERDFHVGPMTEVDDVFDWERERGLRASTEAEVVALLRGGTASDATSAPERAVDDMRRWLDRLPPPKAT